MNPFQSKNTLTNISASASIPRFLFVGIILAFLFSTIVFFSATHYMALATLAYCFMCLGVFNRAYAKIHSKFMATAIFLDISLVVTLEIQRNAVKTALAFSLSPLQQVHILVSFIAVLLYFPILYLGWQGLKQKLTPKTRKYHMYLGISAFMLRTAGFILMFTLLHKT